MLNAAFTGFTALPAPSGSSRTWREVLGYTDTTPSNGDLYHRYLSRRASAYLDKGGTAEAFQEVTKAYEAARFELGYSS
jgi:hypothetical protein